MPIVSLNEMLTVRERQVLAGLDLGTKTIGLAVSDRLWQLAHPRPVLKRTKFQKDAAKLLEFVSAESVGGFILGLPLNMDGTEGPRAQSTRAFANNLVSQTEIPIAFWDERLSTVAAERSLLEMDLSRKKRAGRIDSAAACFILQGALDRLYLMGEDDD
ncbi:MAG: Holliday junction resolvase RuvX [Pseudomonadota bacterium]